MRRQPSPYTTTGEVDRQLDDTAYDNVVIVKNNIDTINGIAESIATGNINTVSTNIEAIDTVAAGITDITTVSTSITDINAVADALETGACTAVTTNIIGIVSVANNIADVVNVANNEADIDIVAYDLSTGCMYVEDDGLITEPITTGTGASKIGTVADNIEDVIIVANNIPSINTTLDTKVDKVAGKQLSTEDYTTTEKDKLAEFSNRIDVAGRYYDSFSNVFGSSFTQGVIYTNPTDKLIFLVLAFSTTEIGTGSLYTTSMVDGVYMNNASDYNSSGGQRAAMLLPIPPEAEFSVTTNRYTNTVLQRVLF